MLRRSGIDPRRPARPDGPSNQLSDTTVSAAPLQTWRAWSGCGDGGQLHLVIDPAAGQVWLLPAEETPMPTRSIE